MLTMEKLRRTFMQHLPALGAMRMVALPTKTGATTLQLQKAEECMAASKFPVVYCSQCGGEFDSGDHGFSLCESHAGMLDRSRVDAAMHAIKLRDGAQQHSNRRALELQIERQHQTGQTP